MRSAYKPIPSGRTVTADFLDEVSRYILNNVSVEGGRFVRRGRNLVLQIDREHRRGTGDPSEMAMGKVTAVTGTSHAAVYDVEAIHRTGLTLTSAVPYIRPVDSGIDIQEAAVDDWAMLALVHDGGVPYWILWQVPEVIVSGACP